MIVSGSQLERALECAASTALPKVRSSGEPAKEGIAIHAYLELVAEYGPEKAIGVIAENKPWADYVEICEAIDLDSLPTELAHEIAFAFDPTEGSAREIGRGNRVDYRTCNLLHREIPCRLDVVGVSGDAVFVGDYKSGRGEVTAAKHNVQLAFGALCAARAYGKDSAVVQIIRPGRGGARAFKDTATLDAFDLGDLANRIRAFVKNHWKVVEDIEARRSPTVYEGAWCRYCPSYNHCPAKQALAVRVGNGEEIREMQNALTPETAAEVYRRAKAAKEFLDKIFQAIYGMASNEPIDLGNGRMLGEVTKPGNEKLDGDVVYEALKSLHSQEVAQRAVKRTATKKAIEDALRGQVPKLAPAIREVLGKVREDGGAERKEITRIEEYPKE